MMRRPVARTVGRTAVIAGTATAVSGRVARRQEARYAEQDYQAEQQMQPEATQPPPPPPPPPAGGPSSADIERLQQLADLKNQGVLTEEEFAAEKAKVLNS
jgi:Short C-terminal domain